METEMVMEAIIGALAALARQGQETFDETEYFEREIAPLISDLHAKCAGKGIPLMMLACPRNTGERMGVQKTVNFPGARTPLLFRLVLAAEEHAQSAGDPVFRELLIAAVKDAGNNDGNADNNNSKEK